MKSALVEESSARPTREAIDTEKCQSPCLAPIDLDLLANQVITSDKAQRMAEFFSLLGDPNRLRILSILAQHELCVCDLAALLGMGESAVSHQLRTLKAMRLVSYQKRGRKVFYRLLDDRVLELYRSVAEHLDGTN